MKRLIVSLLLGTSLLLSIASGTSTGNTTYYTPIPNSGNETQICVARCQAKYESCKAKTKINKSWCTIDLESCIHVCG